jgi:PAS domain S-box-containing protein
MYLIRLSQDTYETLFDSLPALIFVTDRKGTFQWVNRTFIEFFGMAKENSTGKKYSDLFSSSPVETPLDFQEIISSGDIRKGVVKSVRLPHSDEKILKLDYFPWTE